ncbi:MAG: response regulator transcription factor [Dehalococcoidia bacterium]|nr:response regulator transcription factor [Dehalococcoidia bacterium]
MKPLRVLLVDDHILFRKGLRGLLSARDDIEIVGECGDGADAVEQTRRLAPDIVLMDIRMCGLDGLEATRRIAAEMPDVKVVMLTVSEQDDDLFEAIKSGARGYLLKNVEPEELLRLVRAVADGEAALSPAVAAKMLDQFNRGPERESEGATGEQPLTEREKEVLSLLVEGLGNKQIAHRLSVSESTVRNHLHNALYKLRLENRIQLALYVYKQGLAGQRPAQQR